MVAARTALENGNKVACLNFSSDYAACDFTNQSKEIDEHLVLYLGEGTNIPGQKLVDMTAKTSYPVYTLIITDAEIGNLDTEINNLEQARKQSSAGASILLAGNPTENAKRLKAIGYTVQFAKDTYDLGNLTLETSRTLYAGGVNHV